MAGRKPPPFMLDNLCPRIKVIHGTSLCQPGAGYFPRIRRDVPHGLPTAGNEGAPNDGRCLASFRNQAKAVRKVNAVQDPSRAWPGSESSPLAFPWFYRLRAGSRSAWWRARASADTRAYLASGRTDIWPLLAISIGVPVPSSAL